MKSTSLILEEEKTPSGSLAVKDYPMVAEQAVAFIEARPLFEIANDSDAKRAKETRAELNKVLNLIKRRRIDVVNDFVQVYEGQCKSIEKLLDVRQKEFGQAITDYENKVKSEDVVASATAKTYTATLKFDNESLVKKITEFAEKYNCELTIK